MRHRRDVLARRPARRAAAAEAACPPAPALTFNTGAWLK